MNAMEFARQAPALATMAGRAMDLLEQIASTLARGLELQETSTKNFPATGSIPLGGSVGTQQTTVLEANPNRRGVTIQNLSGSGGPQLTIGLGNRSPINGQGIVILPGGSWDGRVSGEVFKGSVTLISTAACTFSGVAT